MILSHSREGDEAPGTLQAIPTTHGGFSEGDCISLADFTLETVGAALVAGWIGVSKCIDMMLLVSSVEDYLLPLVPMQVMGQK